MEAKGFGSARLTFLEARLGLGSLALGSLGNNLAQSHPYNDLTELEIENLIKICL